MRRTVPALLVLSTLLVGCNSMQSVNREKDLLGKWKVTDMKSATLKANDPMVARLKEMATQINMEFRADKTYLLTGIMPMEGSWSLSGDKATLTMTKVNGQSLDELAKQGQGNPAVAKTLEEAKRPSIGTISADGKTLTIEDTSGEDAGTLTLIKQG